MAVGAVEEDNNEFDMLLGEIPNATLGNALMGQHSSTVPSRELDFVSLDLEKESSPSCKDDNLSSPTSVQVYKSSQLATHQGSISFYGGTTDDLKLLSKESNYQISKVINYYNLPSDKSLTLSFDQTATTENPATVPSTAASDKNKQNCSKITSLFNEHFDSHQNKSLSGKDTVGMNFLPPHRTLNRFTLSSIELEAQSPAMQRNELVNLSDGNDCQHSVELFKPDGFESEPMSESLFCKFPENQQVFPLNNVATPLNHGMNYQLFTSIHGAKLPNSCPDNLKMDVQPSPKHITLPGMVCHGMGTERHGQFHQQCKYAQLLHNHSSEVLQVPKSMNLGMASSNGNTVHPCFEFPFHHQFKGCYQYPYLNANALKYKFNQLNYCQYKPQGSSERVGDCWSSHGHKLLSGNGLNCSAKDFQDHQIHDKVVMQCIPKNMLARSHGVNKVQILRPNPHTIDQSLHFRGKNVRLPDSLANQSCLSIRSLQFDYKNYKCSLPDGFDPRLASKSMQIKYNAVDKVVGRMHLMAKDQHGCRFLQSKFIEGSQDDIHKIFSEIICHIVELMTDPFGNYLVQKLLDACNDEQMILILRVITRKTGELFRISCNTYGTRAVQKLIENLKTPEQISMVLSSLEPDIILLMKNINGNHVAQRCLQYLYEYSKYIMDTAISYCHELAKDRQGCRVLQTCLRHSNGVQKQMLMAKITSKSFALSKDPYGNYVVQCVLEQNDQWATAAVLKQLKGNFVHLSMQKYSSNVVEKCLKASGKNKRVPIIEELLASALLPQILQDKFGNYVMQSALRESKANRSLHISLVAYIRRHASVLRHSPYGKKVLECDSFIEATSSP